MTICGIASITVTTATIALWLKHRMKHISSRCPLLSSRKAANSALLLSPYKSRSSLHLWNYTLIFVLVYSLTQSNSLFWHCFSLSSYFFSLTWAILGHFSALLLLLSVLLHSLRLHAQLSQITAIVWLCYSTRQLQLSEYTCLWENQIIGLEHVIPWYARWRCTHFN